MKTSLLTPIPYGLIELDEAGTVLYYKAEEQGLFVRPAGEMVGKNFFTEIDGLSEDSKFQEEIKRFIRSGAPTHIFSFTFEFQDRAFPAKVLLARIKERTILSGTVPTASLYIHIR